jgi:hypothetical protein
MDELGHGGMAGAALHQAGILMINR